MRVVGREAELEVLQRELEALPRATSLRRLALVGEPGVGRTAVLEAARTRALQLGWDTAFHAGLEARVPALVGLVCGRLGVEPDAGAAAISQSLARNFAARASAPVTIFAGLLGVAPVPALEASARLESLCSALFGWLEQRTLERPLVWLVDDADHLDADARAFLDWLTAHPFAGPALLVTVGATVPGARELPLSGLRRNAMVELLRAAQVPAPEVLVPYTQGSVRLAFELAKARAEGLAEPFPSDLGELVVRRVESLGGPAAGVAAVVARFPAGVREPVLAAALGPDEARAGVAMLSSRGLVRPGSPITWAEVRTRAAVARLPLRLDLMRLEAWALSEGAASVEAVEALRLVWTDGERSSLLDELAASAALAKGHRAEAIAHLERALGPSGGVRRMVLARQLCELHAFQGEPDRAVAVVDGLGYVSPKTPPPPPPLVARRRAALAPGPFDAWEHLPFAEARVALELARAEVLAHGGKADPAKAAFLGAEQLLAALAGPLAQKLWVRWLKTWAWFVGETLADPRAALAACARVRALVGDAALKADVNGAAAVRAEQLATSRSGDFARARALSDEQLALARRAGDLSEECMGLSTRGILELGQGDLFAARDAFERSLQLARQIGFRRREAIALHNLGLVQGELGEFSAAQESQGLYLSLGAAIGHGTAQGYGPLSFAVLDLANGAFDSAERRVARVDALAEKHGWTFLQAWGRALVGQARVLRWLSTRDAALLERATTDLRSALGILEAKGLAWTEELDPGEVYGVLAAATALGGDVPGAQQVLQHARGRLPTSAPASQAWLAVAADHVAGKPLGPSLAWFKQRGYARVLSLWSDLGRAR